MFVILLLGNGTQSWASASSVTSPASPAASVAATVRPAVAPPPIKPEHVVAGPPASAIAHLSARMKTDLPRTTASVGGAARLSSAQGDTSLQFLTRPYTTWHDITSVFDHCNPDYSVDGRVCEYDGSVGLRSNGIDPTFSLGYAQTPGGGDYISYDGHNGWDYALRYENVLAAAPGTVTIAGIDSVNTCFGQNVVIDHGNGFSTRYGHLSSIYVTPGEPVTRGQVIGVSGNTGCSSGPHLHFGVYITSSWTAVDPWGWAGAPGADPWPSDPGNLWLTGYAQFPLPAAPTNVIAGAGNAAATVNWTPPSFNGGTAIATYNVTASPGGLMASVPGTATTATVVGLTNGTSYSFTVTAVNSVGASVSSPSNAVIPSATAAPVASLSRTSVAFDTQPLGSTTTVAIGLTDLSGISLSISGISTTGDYSQSNDCGASLAPLASCTISVAFRPGTMGTRPGTLTLNDNGGGSPQVVPLSGTGEAWIRSESLGGRLAAGPGVSSWGVGRLDVFVRGGDNALWHRWYSGNMWWPWESLGGILASEPTGVSWASGRVDVFARGGDNALWHRAYDGTSWQRWESLGGILATAPTVTSWAPGRLDVFTTGTDGALWHRWFDSGAWHDWESLGGILASRPAAASWANGRLDIVARAAGDNALWHLWYDGGHWFAWEKVLSAFGSSPALASWGPGRLDIFAQASDGSLLHGGYDATGWRDWTSLGGRIGSDPAAVSWGTGRIDVFAAGTDGSLWHTWFD